MSVDAAVDLTSDTLVDQNDTRRAEHRGIKWCSTTPYIARFVAPHITSRAARLGLRTGFSS
jgi:hypothetical protein